MNLQWYPGHMTKTKRLIEESLSQIDVVVEVIDARVPKSSRNPDFDTLFERKPRILIMNKYDLADPIATKKWEAHFRSSGINVITTNSLSGKGVDKIAAAAKAAIADKIEKDIQRGVNRAVRLMIVGIPNVGKSSIINRLVGKASTKTGDKPGVTRGKQWIRLKEGIELLDTPGILWPRFEDMQVGMNLAFIGSIKDEVMDIETLCCHLLEFLQTHYAEPLMARYKLDDINGMSGLEMLEYISKKRGFIVSGGELDIWRGANIVIDEFRAAKIGAVSLELP